MLEEWKDVKGYEGSYQVSNLGRVKSLKRKMRPVDKILSLPINNTGYLNITLCKDGNQKTLHVHVLMAITYLNHKQCGNNVVIDHINGDKLDNRLLNLQLISNRENISKSKSGYSSKFVGVSWDKALKKWCSKIRIGRKQKHLGYFTVEREASTSYQKALKGIK